MNKIIQKTDEKPIRVILEKPTSEKILAWIWGTIKIVLFLMIISSLLNASEFETAQSTVEKTYFNGHFGVEDKNFNAEEIAVIQLMGEISDVPDPFGNPQGVSVDDTIFLLHEARIDPEISAILLRIDSPGGTVLAAEKISTLVQEIQTEKPVFALLEGSANSGAYYIASVTSKIFAYPSSITGSIGVIIELPKVVELLQKVGVEIRTLTSGELKDIGSPFRDLSGEETELLNNLITESYDQFVQTVATGRKMSVEEVRQLADGRIYSGVQAKANGLVDENITSFAEVLEMVQTEIAASEVQAVAFSIPLSPWEEFLFSIRSNGISLQNASELVGKEILGRGMRFWAQ